MQIGKQNEHFTSELAAALTGYPEPIIYFVNPETPFALRIFCNFTKKQETGRVFYTLENGQEIIFVAKLPQYDKLSLKQRELVRRGIRESHFRQWLKEHPQDS